MEEKICKNCKNWTKSSIGLKKGSCELSRIRNEIMYSGCGLKTHESFGCNQFFTKIVEGN